MKHVSVVVLSLLVSVNAFAFDKVYNSTLADVEDLVVKSNGVKLNNFAIVEARGGLFSGGLTKMKVSFSARNKGTESKHVSAMIVGKSGSEILWAVTAEPSFSLLSAGDSSTVDGEAFISRGTLNRTKTVWVRVVGDI